MSQLQISRCSATRLVREDPFTARDLAHPHGDPDLGIGERDGSAVHAHHAAIGHDEAADRLQQRGLAGAVGTEQGEHLAALHLEVDVEEDLDRSVGRVDVVDLEHRHVLGIGGDAPLLLLLVEELFDHERDVALHELRPAQHEQAAEDRAERHHGDERGALAVLVGDGGNHQPTEEAAEQEDVEADQRERLGPHAVRHHRRDDRPDLGERRELEPVRDRDEDDQQFDRTELAPDRDEHAVPDDQPPEQSHRPAGIAAEQTVAVATCDRDHHEGRDVGDRQHPSRA